MAKWAIAHLKTVDQQHIGTIPGCSILKVDDTDLSYYYFLDILYSTMYTIQKMFFVVLLLLLLLLSSLCDKNDKNCGEKWLHSSYFIDTVLSSGERSFYYACPGFEKRRVCWSS